MEALEKKEGTEGLFRHCVRIWFQPVDSIRLDAFRMCLGISLLLYMGFRWTSAPEWLTGEGFHISSAYLPYFSLSVPLLTVNLLPWFGGLFFGSMILFILGWQARWTGAVALACLIYVSLADQLAFFSPNKVLWISMLVLVSSPLGTHWSLGVKRRDVKIPAWPIRTLQAFIIIHLFTAGWNKVVFGEWFQNPYVLWTQIQGTFRTDAAAFLLHVLPPWAWAIMQLLALLFELLVPLLLLRRNLRWIGIVWGSIFQLMIALTMHHLIYFNLIMLSFFVLFIDDNILRGLERRFVLPGTPFDKPRVNTP